MALSKHCTCAYISINYRSIPIHAKSLVYVSVCNSKIPQELVYKDGNGRAAFEKEILKYFILCSMTVTLLDEKKDTQKNPHNFAQ